MERLRMPDRDLPSYEPGETLKLLLNVRSDLPREVVLRLTLRTDSDAGLGTAWSEPLMLSGGEQEVSFSLPLGNIEKGTFYGSVGIYEELALKRRKSLDHVPRAFKMEVTGSPVWSTDAHGYVSLGEITVER